MNLNEIAKLSKDIAYKRIENGALMQKNTVSFLKHAAGEVIEAVEAYGEWKDSSYEQKEKFANELADIIVCVLIAANIEDINIEQAIKYVVSKNKARAELKGDKI